MAEYVRASTDWFAELRFGIAVHWTAQSQPVTGPAMPFADAVDAFDVPRFVGQTADAGADYLLFTLTHALQMIPAPCAALDRILPGRTTRRDLAADLADECGRRGLRFLLYYNHSCNGRDDVPWAKAVGYYGPDFGAFADRLMQILAELGERYGDRVAAWWFDSSYSLDPRGPANTVTADLRGYQFPWESFTAAAKRGHPQRLVCYNPGVDPAEWNFLYTTHQDYLAGEANGLAAPPTNRYHATGLQNHRWICLDNPSWMHGTPQTPLLPPRFPEQQVLDYARTCHRFATPLTINIDIDQAATLHPQSLAVLSRIAGQG